MGVYCFDNYRVKIRPDFYQAFILILMRVAVDLIFDEVL